MALPVKEFKVKHRKQDLIPYCHLSTKKTYTEKKTKTPQAPKLTGFYVLIQRIMNY